MIQKYAHQKVRVIHRREMDRSLMYLSIRDGSLLDIFERSILSFPHFHVLRVFEGINFFGYIIRSGNQREVCSRERMS